MSWAIFVGVPNQSFMLEPYLCDPSSVCLDRQLIKSDGEGFARVVLHNGGEHLRLGLPDTVLGVATPCPEPVPNNEAMCTVHTGNNWPQPDAATRKERADQLFSELGLDVNPKLQGNLDAQNRMWQALYKYGEVFSQHEADIGRTDETTFEIKLKPESRPVKQQARPLHPRMMADLESQIQCWLEADIIEVSESDWASPLVPVKKRMGQPAGRSITAN